VLPVPSEGTDLIGLSMAQFIFSVSFDNSTVNTVASASLFAYIFRHASQ
jgi:hypothetical protein